MKPPKIRRKQNYIVRNNHSIIASSLYLHGMGSMKVMKFNHERLIQPVCLNVNLIICFRQIKIAGIIPQTHEIAKMFHKWMS